MKTREIPKADWARELDRLASRQTLRYVNVRMEGENLGDQVVAENMPLIGISLETKGSEAGSIEFMLAKPEGEGDITHQIANPQRIYAEETDDGDVKVLDIEDGARVKTLIFFQ